MTADNGKTSAKSLDGGLEAWHASKADDVT